MRRCSNFCTSFSIGTSLGILSMLLLLSRRPTIVELPEVGFDVKDFAIPPTLPVKAADKIFDLIKNLKKKENLVPRNDFDTCEEGLDDEDDIALAQMPPVTFEKCLASLAGKDLSKKEKTIHWIHIPKAGSSLSAAIYAYLCQVH